jgi:hypothetical protein
VVGPDTSSQAVSPVDCKGCPSLSRRWEGGTVDDVCSSRHRVLHPEEHLELRGASDRGCAGLSKLRVWRESYGGICVLTKWHCKGITMVILCSNFIVSQNSAIFPCFGAKFGQAASETGPEKSRQIALRYPAKLGVFCTPPPFGRTTET